MPFTSFLDEAGCCKLNMPTQSIRIFAFETMSSS
jgi:hypothetical protein